jgi:hypothetical protein
MPSDSADTKFGRYHYQIRQIPLPNSAGTTTNSADTKSKARKKNLTPKNLSTILIFFGQFRVKSGTKYLQILLIAGQIAVWRKPVQ